MHVTNPYLSLFLLVLLNPLGLPGIEEGSPARDQAKEMVSLNGSEFRYGDTITVRFRNTLETGEEIAVITSGCGLKDGGYLPRLVVEKKVEAAWERAGAPFCIAIATPPIHLAPGQSRSVTIPVDTGLDTPHIPGEFRYRFDIRTGREGSYPARTALPIEMRMSPAFRITGDPD